ncbi:hypothetical protein [Prevotella jejuni]
MKNNPTLYGFILDPILGLTYLDELLSDYNITRITKGSKGIKETLNIIVSNPNTLFVVKAKWNPLSVADVAQKYKISPLIT